MKQINKKIIALVLSLTFVLSAFVVFGSSNNEEAEAYSDGFMPSASENVYYFSDSEPSRQDILNKRYYVYYDVHSLISPQEFKFLVYSGYFWGFESTEECKITVIIELKTMMPEESVLQDLFTLLDYQHVGYVFISPYLSEYSFAKNSASDPLVSCHEDKYAFFLRFVFGYMYYTNYELLDYEPLDADSLMLLDGRFINIDSSQDSYDIGTLCLASPTLRRILNYCRYGAYETDEQFFEESLYQSIWKIYFSTFMEPIGSDNFDYFDNANIDEFIHMWDSDYWMDPDIISEDAISKYEYERDALISNYYADLAVNLLNDNIHILVNITGSSYIDILDSSASVVTLTDYQQFINYLDTLNGEIDNIFALAIWPWNGDYFYDLLCSIQDNLSEISSKYNKYITDFPVFLWSKFDIPLGAEGLLVIPFSDYYESEDEISDDEFLSILEYVFGRLFA